MGKRAGIALGLLLGIGIAYEVVTTGPSDMGVTVSHHRRAAHATSGCSQNISCGIQAGDKVGNWWVLQTDGTMLSGSSLTLAAQGAPSVSPITLNGTTQFFQSTTTPSTFPLTDFSIVCVVNMTSLAAPQAIVAKWQTAALSYLLLTGATTNSRPSFLVNTSTGANAEADAVGSFTTGQWVGVAGTYTSATSTATIRFLSATATGTASGTGILSTAIHQNMGAESDGSAKANMQTRGCFLTETPLSVARQDAIMAGGL